MLPKRTAETRGGFCSYATALLLVSESSGSAALDAALLTVGGFFYSNLNRGSRLFQNDSEQPFVVETAQIRMERLCLTNHGVMTRKSLSERPEAPISIDVINDEYATRF